LQGKRRSKPSRACETLRMERSETGMLANWWTLLAGTAMGNGTSREVAQHFGVERVWNGMDSEEERSAREDEPGLARVRGPVVK